MKIELKRFTINARLSRETTAFAADVWVDGLKVGHAENDGHGGATSVRLEPAVRSKIEAHGRTLVPEDYKGFTSGAEWVVDQLVEVTLQKKAEASLVKKIVKEDAKAKAVFEKEGYHAARFRNGLCWRWFSYKPGADPRAVATAIADKHQGAIDELVML